MSDCDGRAQLIVVRNGHALATQAFTHGAAAIDVEIPASEAPVQAWYRVDVLDAAGQALTVSTPIFLGPSISPYPRTFDSMAGNY